MIKEINTSDNSFFAECYKQKTIEELVDALVGKADSTTCRDWNINAREYKLSIKYALLEKINDLQGATIGELFCQQYGD